MIKLKNLNKFFFKGKKNEIHVLNDISLDLGEKGLVAIHGASGSGKTTLLNVIGGLDKVQSGEIDFYDEYITGYKSSVWDKIRNEYVGYVFQNYYLLPELSVFENIKFVLRNLGIKDENEIEQRVNYVLKALGMYQFRKKKALQLSGGQQQRVAIARALVKSPKVVIADEPTGNLDSKNTVEIMNIIKEISKETLVILVTHDKEIANVYADRIIYMVDGKITNDIINEYNSEHNIVDDAIYLKDLKNYQSVKNEQLDIKYYSDEKFENVEIKLILKNDTLYVDVEGFDNVKLANKSSGVIIKEEHYKKKTKEEAIKTTYEVKKLDHLDVKKEKGMLFSFKQAFKQAFKKLLRIGRKGKLMLISFAIAGAIIAYAVATFAAVTINRPEKYMKLPKGYVSFESNDYIAFDLNELETLKANDEKFYINPFNDFKGINLDFLNTDGTVGLSYNPYYSVAYDRLEHAKNYKLAIGKYSEDVNEIVITTAFAKTFLNDSRSQDFGIWTKVNILQEKIRFSNVDAKIVGIVESDLSLIFVSDSFILYQSGSFKPLEAYKNINFVYGIKPKENHEISVNQAVIEFITSKEAKNVVFPVVIDGFLITGVHDVDVEYLYLQETIKNNLNEYYSISIYSSNPTKLIKDLKEKYDILAVDVYKDGVKMFKNEQAARLIGVSITTAILVGATLVGFYFVIRSSLIERIYEVAVYRALGVKKKEVVFSFGVEIISITTITTLMGYLFMSYILKNVQNSVLGDFMQLYINSLSLLAGVIVIYLLNLLVGLLPIFMLLRKTPSQILSQYDI